MPALFTWTDAYGDNQFSDPYDWSNTSGVLTIPGAGDDILFTNFAGAGGSGGPSSGGATGAGGPSGGSPGDCEGMVSDPNGPFNSIFVTTGYTGTITLAGPVQTLALCLESGTIDQPLPSGGSDITVLGGEVPNEYTGLLFPQLGGADFNWTGGTLNSTDSGATLHITGSSTTAVINPQGAGFQSTGDTISLENGSAGNFLPGTLTFTGGSTGLVVNANCLATIEATGTTEAAGATVTFSIGTASTGSPLNWIKAGGNITVNGAATWDGAKVPLENDGGTFTVQGGATAAFTGAVGPADQAASYRQTGTTGLTLIQNGSSIEVANSMYLAAGKLSTFATTNGAQPVATLDGDLTDAGADIVISDNAYNAAGVIGHQYGTFEVTGNVRWSGGVYRPYLGIVGIGIFEQTIADYWQIDGSLTVSGGPNGATLGPMLCDPVVSGDWFTILNAANGTTVPVGSAYPNFQLPGFTLTVNQVSGDWIITIN
jgi:hypothetical protein